MRWVVPQRLGGSPIRSELLVGRNDVHAVRRRLQWNSARVVAIGWRLHRHHQGPQFLIDPTNTERILLPKPDTSTWQPVGTFSWQRTGRTSWTPSVGPFSQIASQTRSPDGNTDDTPIGWRSSTLAEAIDTTRGRISLCCNVNLLGPERHRECQKVDVAPIARSVFAQARCARRLHTPTRRSALT